MPVTYVRFVTGNRIAKMRNASACCAGSVIRRIRLDDQIGLAKQPAIGKLRQRRQLLRIAFRRAALRPLFDQRDLLVVERPLADEMADAGLDLPRRHEAAARHLRDLRGAAADFVVGRQAETVRDRRRDGRTRRTSKMIGATSREKFGSCARAVAAKVHRCRSASVHRRCTATAAAALCTLAPVIYQVRRGCSRSLAFPRPRRACRR